MNFDDFIVGPQSDESADAELYFAEQEWLAEQHELEMQHLIDADGAEMDALNCPFPED